MEDRHKLIAEEYLKCREPLKLLMSELADSLDKYFETCKLNGVGMAAPVTGFCIEMAGLIGYMRKSLKLVPEFIPEQFDQVMADNIKGGLE